MGALERPWQPAIAVLRAERSVELAVLFGSMAIGEDTRRSDIDLYVQLAGRSNATASLALQARLSNTVDRPVHVVAADPATAPNLVLSIICEGQVLVDRNDAWKKLLAREHDIAVAANAEAAAMMSRAREVLRGARG